jgi:superfamily II DNA or RNA helicase
MKTVNLYNIYIYEKYLQLKNSNNLINNDNLWKIFEWFTCIKLQEKYGKTFYEYDDIEPEFKELNSMSKNDTGIDCCDLTDTIVQCKLRKKNLNWKECSTFFASQNIFNKDTGKTIIKWPNLVISRNAESKLSENLLDQKARFNDVTFPTDEIITYCENLLENPPKYPKIKVEDFKLRDYQEESIKLINEKLNIIISLPTGCGKNVVMIYSMKPKSKYLILVPRIILMEQLKEELIKHKPEFTNGIQCIGDDNNVYDESKNICVCVYNSVYLIEPYFESFSKIYIDEAHHIVKPDIYNMEDNEIVTNNLEEVDDLDNDSDSEENDDVINDSDSEKDDSDSEDEIKQSTGYIQIIKKLAKYNNNIYLSATIDKIDDFEYYKKDIRDMIDMKYLCDYTIHVPIFTDDPTNKNVCSHLINNYKNMIIYCNSQKEGKSINTLFNSIQKGCSQYIDCKTSKKTRNSIIKKYKNGEIPFLVNVRILVEGFDAPITKGICFMHLPSNKTTLIQIIGRALRLHKLKKFANIILPYSTDEDGTNINRFIKVMAQNDKRIKQSYESKKEGGYISIENIEKNTEGNDKSIFRYEMIYNSMGKLINSEEIWIKQFDEVKNYIDTYNKRPCEVSKCLVTKKLGKWLSHQKTNYNSHLMTNKTIKDKWEEFTVQSKYKNYFISIEDKWFENLNKVKKYIDENGIRPHEKHSDNYIGYIGKWLSTQLKNYKNHNDQLKHDKFRKCFENFMKDKSYYKHFISDEDQWIEHLNGVKNYIDSNKKRPSSTDKNTDIKFIGLWITRQTKNYKENTNLMSNNNLRILWEEFINNNKYKKYFISNEELWFETLEKVKNYIDVNYKRPSQLDSDIEVGYFGKWLTTQGQNYKKIIDIMKNENIRKQWENFIQSEQYQEYFISNEELWYMNLEKVKNYIVKHKQKLTRKISDDKEKIQLALWINTQRNNYLKKAHTMSNVNIQKSWESFITDNKYKNYI